MAETGLALAFDLLRTTVAAGIHRAVRFRSELNHLQTTLASVEPAIRDIQNFNNILGRPPHEIEAFTARLVEGEKLIQSCYRVKYWNLFRVWHYSKKLTDFEANLVKFFQINAAALHFRETKSVSVVVGNLEEKFNEMVTILKRIEVAGSSSNGCPETDLDGRNAVQASCC